MSTSTLVSMSAAAAYATRPAIRFEAGSITGLLERPGQVSRLLAALAGAGVDRSSIEVCRGESANGASSSLVDRLRGGLACLGPERQLASEYRSELAAGAVLVTVRNVPGDRHDRVAGILKASGGYFVHGFGRFTVRRFAL